MHKPRNHEVQEQYQSDKLQTILSSCYICLCTTTLLGNLTVRTTFLKSREGKVPNMLAFHENIVLTA